MLSHNQQTSYSQKIFDIGQMFRFIILFNQGDLWEVVNQVKDQLAIVTKGLQTMTTKYDLLLLEQTRVTAQSRSKQMA